MFPCLSQLLTNWCIKGSKSCQREICASEAIYCEESCMFLRSSCCQLLWIYWLCRATVFTCIAIFASGRYTAVFLTHFMINNSKTFKGVWREPDKLWFRSQLPLQTSDDLGYYVLVNIKSSVDQLFTLKINSIAQKSI